MLSTREKILKIKSDLLTDVNNIKKDIISEGVAEKIRELIKNVKAFKDEITGDAELSRNTELKSVINDLMSIITLINEFVNKNNKFFKKYGSTIATQQEQEATNNLRNALDDLVIFLTDVIESINP